MSSNSLYPKQIEISPETTDRLITTLKSAYKDIVREIDSATSFGVANRKAILKQIEGILQQLNVDVDEFVKGELPKFYISGANDAVAQLSNIGAEVGISEGFNRIHTRAIIALVEDTQSHLQESIRGVYRSATNLLNRQTRDLITQQIAKGFIAGEALRTTRLAIKGVLQEQGLSAIVDKAGRSWSLDRYAEMLFRTKVVEARNRGMVNRLVENGYDLVQVSSHPGSCPLCAPWQGKILSMTGATKQYPTLTEAQSSGLFHPNCRHAINVVAPALARKTRAYDTNLGDYGAPGQSIDFE